MKAKDIISVPDKRLRQRSQRVGVITDEVKQIAESMKAATLDWEKGRNSEVGVALAAVQIGILERIIVIRLEPNDPDSQEFEVLLNPEITKYEGEEIQEPEGCLSIPDVYGLVPRYKSVRVKALDLEGRPVRLKAEGFLSRVLQHEIDHLHGKLFVDKVKDEKFYKIGPNGQLKHLPAGEIDATRVLWRC